MSDETGLRINAVSVLSRVEKMERALSLGGDGACICRNPTAVRYDRGDSAARGAGSGGGDVCATCGGGKLVVRVVRVPAKVTPNEWGRGHEPQD